MSDFEKTLPEAARSKNSELLELAIEQGALKHGKFKLASGAESNFYFDGRRLSMSPAGLSLIVDTFATVLKHLHPQGDFNAVGGPAIGSVPIVGALAYALKTSAYFVRSQPKEHGLQKLVEGPLNPHDKAVLIEDTVTSGGSLLQAFDALNDLEIAVPTVLAVLDRGGVLQEKLAARNANYFSILVADKDGNLTPTKSMLC